MSELFAGPIGGAYALVTGLIQLLSPLTGPAAGAIAVVLFTMAVRLLISPLSYLALRGQTAQARLLPQIEELRRKHARQPDVLRREIADLTRREGSPLAGCLPLLLQLPFFSVMYRLFISVKISGHENNLLRQRLLGVPLGAHWLGGTGVLGVQGLVFACVFALIALVGWLSARVARQFAGPGTTPAGSAVTALSKVAPYATVVFAMLVPLAAGLYLLTSAAWSVTERKMLLKRSRGVERPGSAPGSVS